MIELLLSGRGNILFIIIAWCLLAFVSYNVLTAEAEDFKKSTEKEDKKVCEDYGGEWKSIGGGDRGCKIDNEQAQGLYGIRPGYSHDGTYSDTEYGRIDLDMSDVEATAIEDDVCSKNKDLDIKVCKEREEAEEKAAQEDAICDNEDADTTDIKLCMSDRRQQQLEHNYDKESCEQVNGDWNKKKGSGCTFYEDEQQDILDAAEEQRKIIDEEEQKALAAIDEYNALQAQAQQEEVIEDYSNTVSETNDNDEAVKEVIKQLEGSEPMNNYPITHEPVEEESNNQSEEVNEQEEEEEPEQEEESDDSEDNSSDEGGDSSDSGDDSSSSDDGGDSGDSSESEE